MRLYGSLFTWALLLFWPLASNTFADGKPDPKTGTGKVGVRPYELDWVGRTEDQVPPLIDFESMGNWQVQSKNAQAVFQQSREEQIWGKYVAKLTYHATGENPELTLRPPKPVPVPNEPFDAFSCWIYGNKWGWMRDLENPPAQISFLFLLPDGKEIPFYLCPVNWKEWFLCHYRFDEKAQKILNAPGVCFNGFKILGWKNRNDSTLYFDNVALWKESFKPLVFKPRPKRGIDMFPGQSSGLNTGPGRLPFPTREETILPDSHGKNGRNHLIKSANDFLFQYRGDDGSLIFRYTPKSGTWSDITAQWSGSAPFYPLSNGGINKLLNDQGEQEPVLSRELLSSKINGNKVETRWRFRSQSASAEVEYHFQMIDKSLLIDTVAKGSDDFGGRVPFVSFGSVFDIEDPQAIAVPYFTYVYTGQNRPFIARFKPKGSDSPLFLQAMPDWYRSNASTVDGGGQVGEKGVFSNGNTGYQPKTDGKRNDVYERFFLTISPKFAEVLPTIANPASPWRALGGKKIWHSHGASSNRQADYEKWRNLWQYGVREMLITDHEVGWRDGGESFTFRTKPAPKKGGDQGQYDYARFLQDELGYTYGPYNNYMDFAPVNEFWNTDMVIRLSDGQLQKAWPRCYAPKPSFSVEYCEKLVPEIQKKFHFTAGYCDVHTAMGPWNRPDYDARVPGAGTFAASYYAWGELMLLQKKGFNGPVYSEGPVHYLYSGLTDGNYAQDQGYAIIDNPWLVDFDLLKMHDLECNFGMGKIYMFEPQIRGAGKRIGPEEQDMFLDRYLAATLAFGHTGYLVTDFGFPRSLRSYFMIQAIAARYTQASVESISYLDENGKPFSIDLAVGNGVLQRNQLIVRYKDGTVVAVNGNRTEFMSCSIPEAKWDLSPNGYYAQTADGKIIVESRIKAGKRYDYSVSPEVIFFDGRESWQKLEKACGTGQGICRILADGSFEIIYSRGSEVGFKLDADQAIALDKAGKELGPARLKRARGYLFVEPVKNAYSYLLRKSGSNAKKTKIADWTSKDLYVVPGEKIVLINTNANDSNGNDPSSRFEAMIPKNAPENKTVWIKNNDGSAQVPFFVAPPAEYTFNLLKNRYLLVLANNTIDPGEPVKMEAERKGKILPVCEKEHLPKAIHYSNQVLYDLGEPGTEDQEIVKITLKTAKGQISTEVKFSVHSVPDLWEKGLVPEESKNAIIPIRWLQYRNKEPQMNFSLTGANISFNRSMISEGIKRSGYFIHPPYIKGTGRAWLEYKFTVPRLKDGTAILRAWVGKKDGSTPGDGILFQVAVLTEESNGKEKILAEQTVDGHFWRTIEADLTPYINKKITLRLISDVGPKNNSIADQSHWANPRIEGKAEIRERQFQ
ncbi:MAG: hypothetical protein Q4G69_13385 [Planctomycetia bacterium]|nr:hypothetical protein [Planctomycetia bacterium]